MTEISTKERVLTAALSSFGGRGYDATSLDALAGELGVRKQTILYHYSSKEELLGATIDRAAADLNATFEATLATAGDGWDRIEALVRGMFRLALRRPELLGLLREVSRPGSVNAQRLSAQMEPMIARGRAFLEREMAAGRIRTTDANLVMMSAYSTVVGAATEVEVLRALGIDPTLRSMALRRRELLRFLHSALVPAAATR